MMPGTEVLARGREPTRGGSAPCPTSTASPPPQGYADAWSFTAPVVDMPVHLDWLRARLERARRDA